MGNADAVAAGPTHLEYVLAVNLIIWAGIFLYLVWLDRRIRRLEKRRQA